MSARPHVASAAAPRGRVQRTARPVRAELDGTTSGDHAARSSAQRLPPVRAVPAGSAAAAAPVAEASTHKGESPSAGSAKGLERKENVQHQRRVGAPIAETPRACSALAPALAAPRSRLQWVWTKNRDLPLPSSCRFEITMPPKLLDGMQEDISSLGIPVSRARLQERFLGPCQDLFPPLCPLAGDASSRTTPLRRERLLPEQGSSCSAVACSSSSA